MSNPILDTIKRDLKESEARTRELSRRLFDTKEKLVRASLIIGCPSHLRFGHWECPDSPTGECVYDPNEDPCSDDCIFCHDPDERK